MYLSLTRSERKQLKGKEIFEELLFTQAVEWFSSYRTNNPSLSNSIYFVGIHLYIKEPKNKWSNGRKIIRSDCVINKDILRMIISKDIFIRHYISAVLSKGFLLFNNFKEAGYKDKYFDNLNILTILIPITFLIYPIII